MYLNYNITLFFFQLIFFLIFFLTIWDFWSIIDVLLMKRSLLKFMLCSSCNKNVAVIFINKVENGKSSLEGLCYNCAKEKGINPLEVLAKQSNLSEENLEDMSKQFEDIFNDISENVNMQDVSPEVLEQHWGFAT